MSATYSMGRLCVCVCVCVGLLPEAYYKAQVQVRKKTRNKEREEVTDDLIHPSCTAYPYARPCSEPPQPPIRICSKAGIAVRLITPFHFLLQPSQAVIRVLDASYIHCHTQVHDDSLRTHFRNFHSQQLSAKLCMYLRYAVSTVPSLSPKIPYYS